MIYSTDRILTAHAGSLPRPDDLREMVLAKARGEPIDQATLDARLKSAVAEIVKRQVACGLDVVNDGELSKPNFTDYVSARIAMPVCVDKLRYVGQAELARDLDNFKAALAGVTVAEAFLPANTPGTIEHWMGNEYYDSDEAFLFAIAEAMREEYNAIVDAGFLLQIDDPDLPDGWACLPKITVPEYRKYAALRIDALNHALRDIPREKVRLHVCWGSFHGPHHDDIPLKDIIDLIFRVRAGSGHCTDFIEHPDLLAERLVRYAELVGRENVLAGTDCGLGTRVGHPSICWAKFEAMAEGARRATKILWGRA
ncbi:MAG: cobalamin-independent methionine synthase II family protein [Alphaproteobacteria bacterium]|nr:MAG: cobalamin-independent methionine synthase II family protein [Alphaproteobacteria bacterium]